MFVASVIGASEAAADLALSASLVPAKLVPVVAATALTYQAGVVALAPRSSGTRRRGNSPRYYTTIRVDPVVATAGGATTTVWTDAPQAARLEFGFVGADSLGRHYSQGPRSHWFAAPYDLAVIELGDGALVVGAGLAVSSAFAA